MKELFLIGIVVMIFIIIFQIAKASEYVSVLRGEVGTRKQNNKINGFLLITFLILGLLGAYWCNELFYKKTLFPQGSASVEGEQFDFLFMVTTLITGIVFVITQVALFWFAFRYQEKDGRKAYFYPHNTTLELIWTTIPAITLTVLVVFGLKQWMFITGDAPEKSEIVEITGHQFGWEMRYPGADGVLGKIDYKKYNQPSGNIVAVDFNDPTSHDDLHVSANMKLPVGRPVKLVIHAQDVIHDVGLAHFRLKMDAVPGIPTTLWFTPKYTTKQMKEKTGNPEFTYEISCDQICGAGHFSMRGTIEVVEEAEYQAWKASQVPQYISLTSPAPVAKPADSLVVTMK
jgi:cytochrome c oxidase subunit 2